MEGKSNVQMQQKKVNKWLIDLSVRRGEIRPTHSNPPGFTTDRQTLTEVVQSEGGSADHNLINKKSWDIALAPVKGLPMNLFIMYMAGNTISIFPIMMVGMMAFRPIQALMAIRNTMKMLEHSNQYAFMVLVYILGNLMALALGVYKCNSMGLLPTHESDWLAFHSKVEEMEFSSGGMIF